jgi:hypothetical protein
MSGTAIEATKDVSGIANVGWIDAGDWLEYNIDVPANGDYTFYFRISANATTNFDLKVDDVLRETVQVATTGGWQSWKTLQTNLSLPAGKHKVRIYTSKGMFNINWLEIGHPGQPTFSEEIKNSEFRVYPNPAKNKLFIDREIITGTAKVQVLDLTGRILSEKLFGIQQFRLELDCSHLKAGSYLVVFRDENQTGTRLFVKE